MITVNQKKSINLSINGEPVSMVAMVSYIDIGVQSRYPVTQTVTLSNVTETLLQASALMELKQLTQIVILNDLTDVDAVLYLTEEDKPNFSLWEGKLLGRKRTLVYGNAANYPLYLVDGGTLT